MLTAQWIYQRGWENIRQLKPKRKPARNNGNSTASNLNNMIISLGRGKVQSMMLKDFLIFIRHSGRVIAIVHVDVFFGSFHR